MNETDGFFTASQIEEMLLFLDPSDKWPRRLHRTIAIESAYRSWLTTECRHAEDPALRRKVIRNGTVQFVNVCLQCGHQFGTSIARQKVPSPEDVPLLGDLSAHDYDKERREAWKSQQMAFWAKQDSKISKEYAAYLKSPKWRAKSRLVISRAQGICEGCRENAATQVHHLTYEHRFDEFLWELVAICDVCHRRAHPEKNDVRPA